MSRKRVKVCGLTRLEDVQEAVASGADLFGFVLAESPRRVSLSRLASLSSSVPSDRMTVAVMVNPQLAEVEEALALVDRVQFHGDESPEFCQRFGRRAIKAFRVASPADLDGLDAYVGKVGAFLLDSYRRGQRGGTGHRFPWTYLQGKLFAEPVFLAGGLTPENVAEAAALPQISGLDVSSGIERQPGIKDSGLMKKFFLAVGEATQARGAIRRQL